jgi:outer membrane protein TolC
MTLGDAVAYALTHNPTVAQQYANVTAAEHALAMQRAIAFPTVSGTLQNSLTKSANYEGAYSIIGAQQQSVFSQNTAQVGTAYTLYSGGYQFLQLAASKAAAAQAEQTLASTEDQVATNVTNAYYTVVARDAIVAVDASDLSYQNVLVTDARVKEHAGVAAGVDVLKAQVAQAKSASTLVGAKADVENARESLAQTIGAPLDTSFYFPKIVAQPQLPHGSVDTLEDIGLNARPDVIAASEAVAAARATRKSWNRELFPQVQINAAIGNQFAPTSAGELIGATPAGQPIYAPRGAPGFWVLGATTTFTLPFVDYGQRHFERVNDDAQLVSAERSLDQTRTQVDIDIRQSYRSAQTAQSQLAYARQEADYGTESARIAQLQYRHGLISLADVIQTQQESETAQYDLVNSRIAYVEAIVKLRVSLGTYTAQRAVADL